MMDGYHILMECRKEKPGAEKNIRILTVLTKKRLVQNRRPRLERKDWRYFLIWEV